MRTGVDALRSIQRYVWKTLEDDVPPLWQDQPRSWEVRMWGTEGRFGFPFARVAAITPVSYSGPASWREAARTFAVHLYPVPMGDPEASLMEVERVEELLFVAFDAGFSYVDKPDPNDATTWATVQSHPRRVPLYDHDGVPLDGPDSVSYVRGANDYLRVVDCPVNRIVDPEDDTYWLVTAEPRVTWRRGGRMPKDGPIVQDVHVVYETP